MRAEFLPFVNSLTQKIFKHISISTIPQSFNANAEANINNIRNYFSLE